MRLGLGKLITTLPFAISLSMAFVSPLAGVDIEECVVFAPLLRALAVRLFQRGGARLLCDDEVTLPDG
jgi:hypothetical protein